MSEMQLQLNISSNATAAEQALSKLASALNRLRDAVKNGLGLEKAADGIGRIVTSLSTAIPEESVSKMERIAAAMERMKNVGAINIRVPAGAAAPIKQVQESMAQAKESADVMAGGVDRANSAMEKSAPAANSSYMSFKKFAKSLIEVKNRSRSASSGLANLIGQFWRIAKMRMLRYVIRELAKSIKEGLDNYKQYSKAIGGDYYKAVTSANDAILKMKNSIGAALAPAIQMLLPIVQRLVNWFINLMNVVNQFLALLRGQSTWSKALDYPSESLEETAESASRASKELKELLADFDELNIIQSESGGGGVGKIGKDEPDYTEMFTEVSKFDEKVRSAVKWIKDNIESIKDIALAIGAAIAGWEISAALANWLGVLTGWATVGIIGVIEFKLATFFDEQFMDDKNYLWLLGNILSTALGGALASQLVGALGMGVAAQATAASIVLAFSATADIVAALGNVDISALSEKNIALATVSALKVGLGTFLMAKTFGRSFMQSGAISIGAMALVLGAELGIKAILGTVDTGEITEENIGAAVLAGLSTGAGAFLFGKTLTGMTAGQSALVAAGIAGLTISVVLGIMGIVGDMKAKDNKITMQAIADKAGSALAGGAGYFFYQARRGLSLTKAGVGALATAGFILAAELSIKSVIGAVNHEELTNETFIEDLANAAKTSLIAGGAAFFKAKQHGFGLTDSAVTALGAAGFMLSVTLLGEAVIGTINAGEITEDAIKKEAIAGLSAAAGGFLIARELGFLPTSQFAAALAAAGFVIMVSCGVNAVVGAVNARELTMESVLNALGAGGGAGLLTAGILYMGGASAAVAAAVGGGVALATGLVILAAISIALAPVAKSGIKWGDLHATEEQIQDYVTGTMFKGFDVKATLNLVDTTVQASGSEKAKVIESATKLFRTMKVLKLGINDSKTYGEMVGQVDELIDRVKTYAESQVTLIETGISLVPIITDTGNDMSAEFLQAGITGWNDVTNYMSGLGIKLSDALINSTTGELKTDWDVEVVNTLLDKISGITSAIMTAQIQGNASAGLRSGLFELKDLDQSSVNSALKLYKDYADKIKKSYLDMYNEQVTSFSSLAAYYYKRAEQTSDKSEKQGFIKLAEKYETDAANLVAWMETSLEAAVAEQIEPGKKLILKFLDDMIGEPVKDATASWTGVWAEFGGAQDVKRAMQGIAATATGIPIEAFELLDITGWDYLSVDLQKKIIKALADSLGGDYVRNMLKEYGIEIPIEIVPDPKLDKIKEAVANMYYDLDEEEQGPSALFDKLITDYGDQYYKEILNELISKFGWDIEDILYAVNIDETLSDEKWNHLRELIAKFKEETQSGLEAPDTSGFDKGLQDMEDSAKSHVNAVRQAFNSLNGITIGFTGGIFGGSFSVTMPQMMAGGGFPGAGEMFIAREAGPELVGRIGNRTAVANNDQIVNGISNGVAAGMGKANEGTDALLGQAVALLSQILRKTGTLQPSAALGRTIKQSSEMYARSGG